MWTNIALLVLIAFLLVVGAIVLNMRRTIRRQQLTLDYYNKTYLSINGWSVGIGSFNYRSFDGGVTWYDVESSDVGFRVLGEAVEANVQSAVGLKRLFDHVGTHGPVDPSQPADTELLKAAGFTVAERAI